jgi:hypothetical protein
VRRTWRQLSRVSRRRGGTADQLRGEKNETKFLIFFDFSFSLSASVRHSLCLGSSSRNMLRHHQSAKEAPDRRSRHRPVCAAQRNGSMCIFDSLLDLSRHGRLCQVCVVAEHSVVCVGQNRLCRDHHHRCRVFVAVLREHVLRRMHGALCVSWMHLVSATDRCVMPATF